MKQFVNYMFPFRVNLKHHHPCMVFAYAITPCFVNSKYLLYLPYSYANNQ